MFQRVLIILILAGGGTLVAAEKPNIIFILCDDLGQGDLGCYGQTLIKTPNLDRMASEGTRFTQFYTGTSVCAPSRASLMTGYHMGHCAIRANREAKPEGQKPLPEDAVTIAQILKSAGYSTACTGKWGLGMFDTTGSPLKKGFDHFYGYNCQRHAHSYFPTYLYDNSNKCALDGKTYAQDLIADDTLAWVRKNKESPFFLYYALTLPHAKYEIDTVGDYEKTNWTPRQKTYAAMVTRIDTDVGRLLTLLKELNLDGNTIIFFAGDNGASEAPNSEIGKHFEQAKGLRGFKRGMYEGGLRQAGLVRWPGKVPAGRVCEDPWAFWDFLPTAAEIAGAKIPDTVKTDGLPMLSFLKGGPAPQREYFYWELHEGNSIQAARFGNWKAVRNGVRKPIELYDLATDRSEQNDVAGAHADVVAKAEQILKTARADHPDWPLVDKSGGKNGKKE